MQPTEKQLAQFKASSQKATEGWAEFMDRFEKSLNYTAPTHNGPKIVMLGRVAAKAYNSLMRHKSMERYLRPYFNNNIIKNVLKKNSLHR